MAARARLVSSMIVRSADSVRTLVNVRRLAQIMHEQGELATHAAGRRVTFHVVPPDAQGPRRFAPA